MSNTDSMHASQTMADDVVFTWTSGGKQQTETLSATKKISSREAVGLWIVGNSIWKVYATTSQLAKIDADYTRAQVDAGLPVGSPAPSFQQGSVKQGTRPVTQGFVLIAQLMDGTNFQKTNASFKSALTKENVSHDKTSTDYQRITAGCNAANKVGLQDCQGYVKPGNHEPIRFVDIHTSWNPQTKHYGTSSLAAELVKTIAAWGK